MTIPVSGPGPESESDTSDLDVLQLFEDGMKLLTAAPVAAFTHSRVLAAGEEFADLLDSMLATGAAERRIKEQR